MALPASGPLSLDEINVEFGGTTGQRRSLTEFYRDNIKVYSQAQNKNIPMSGTISIGNFFGASEEYVFVNTGTIYNFNFRAWYDSVFGAPVGPVKIRFLNSAGTGVIRSYHGAWAFDFGQWPAGSTITLENRGQIHGQGGPSNAHEGSYCVHCNFASQTMRIYNYGEILAGGGAGGYGGAGGNGYWDNCYQVQIGPSVAGGKWYIGVSCSHACQVIYGGGTYCVTDAAGGGCTWIGFNSQGYCNDCRRTQCDRIWTYGGGGGTGGRGWGWDGGNSGGSGGGGPSGANAGWGGSGGTGGGPGAWGASGGWGQNGNNGGGAGPQGGGAPGWAVYGIGALNVYQNSGTIAGRTQ